MLVFTETYGWYAPVPAQKQAKAAHELAVLEGHGFQRGVFPGGYRCV